MSEATLQMEQKHGVKAKQGKYLTFALGSEEYGLEILKVREIIGYISAWKPPNEPIRPASSWSKSPRANTVSAPESWWIAFKRFWTLPPTRSRTLRNSAPTSTLNSSWEWEKSPTPSKSFLISTVSWEMTKWRPSPVCLKRKTLEPMSQKLKKITCYLKGDSNV
jgi:hypothetical protein